MTLNNKEINTPLIVNEHLMKPDTIFVKWLSIAVRHWAIVQQF